MHTHKSTVYTTLFLLIVFAKAISANVIIRVDKTMSPPNWALLERELLKANTDACKEFYKKYFDERGYLMCVERWGGDDGPDDAIENLADWPLLHALGSSDVILDMYKQAWEGHLRQYTEAKTTEVPFARDGMYYKEFPVMFDWQHNAEGLRVFNLQGLSDPYDTAFGQRVKRYAGFYMNEDPGADNYDPQHKIIKSLFNGSRGPLLRKATALDWTGDPIEVENRFDLGHGERNYQEMLQHFEDYNDIVADHPLNLLSTTLALNAYMLTGEPKYKNWLLEYVDAWHDRMKENGSIIPSNIGLDGKIGGETDGKWYGGTYGWAFTVVVPQTGALAHRNRQHWSFAGFMNAYMLTKDDKFLDVWRKQAEAVNAQAKEVNGRTMYPRMYGDDGWYGYVPQEYTYNNLEIYYLSMKSRDKRKVSGDRWLRFLDGDNSSYPEDALRSDLSSIRRRIAAMRNDTTTPDTRLADDPMHYNPASVHSLVHCMLGGIAPDRRAGVLHSRLRYFDPINRRTGIPDDVAALVSQLTDDSITVTLVNVNQVEAREVVVQAGAYAEHTFNTVRIGSQQHKIEDSKFTINLAPGAGETLTISMERYSNQPTITFPWDRE